MLFPEEDDCSAGAHAQAAGAGGIIGEVIGGIAGAVAGLPRVVGGGLLGAAIGLIDKYNQCYP
ncbi:hypothetical protein [Bartonella sp. LB28NMGDW]|uniref:hypothetical protein n=1 Tax=Bartonella sp. LB28NMGDW TaxID=3243549 RepID=UPI0035D0996F